MGTLNNRCRILIGTQKGTLILTTTHIMECILVYCYILFYCIIVCYNGPQPYLEVHELVVSRMYLSRITMLITHIQGFRAPLSLPMNL